MARQKRRSAIPAARASRSGPRHGPAWFGEGCELGDGVRIGAAVSVGPGAKVGSGAMLNRVAVLDGAEVFGGALLEDCIVAPGGIILGDRLRFG